MCTLRVNKQVKQQLRHPLSDMVENILYDKMAVIQFIPKNDTSQRCNWKAALLFGNRFVLKWRHSFTDSHLIVPCGCATHVLSLTVLVARDNDSQKVVVVFFFKVSLFSAKKKIYLSHATKEWPHIPFGKPTFGNEQKCKTEGKLFSY